ncbi:MAG: flagellar assembly protein FliW [Candidatus Eisenbacteria bacterium]|nr:flagellar assembly protein FliW [Candidatus Eisenbacteria bacterium]MCC7144076.1 flagellar assembly protein FliW [Candidatus Eisenbacteria bacterium]
MILRSKSLGEIEVRDEAAIYMPDGLLGFEELKQYVFLEPEEFHPFLWLVSTEEPEIGFAVADPQLFWPGLYEVPLSDSDKDVLDWQAEDQLGVFVLVSVAEGGRRITANLKGPVVINTRNRLAKQVVVYNPAFAVRQPLVQPSTRVVAGGLSATGGVAHGSGPAQRVSVG